MTDGLISLAAASEVAKEQVSKTMTATREFIAKLAIDMADDMERKGVIVDGPTALRAFAATVAKTKGEKTQ